MIQSVIWFEGGFVEQFGTDTSIARIVVLLSGSGRTLANLLEYARPSCCPFEIVRVVSTRDGVRGNQIAFDAGIPLEVLPRKIFCSADDFSHAVVDILDSERADLVVCAGFLSKLVVPDRYLGRILNIHPSLLPLFGGKGYYGDRIHRAVLDSGMKVSGCTVHFVDNEFDAGPIIAQRCVPVRPDDTPDTLASRVFLEECKLYPQVICDAVSGKIWLEGRRVCYEQDIM
jgi:phosphoribosylglycinamide formyltransferase 1